MDGTRLVPIKSADVIVSDRVWSFPTAHRDVIEAYWQRRTAENPKLFNGKILLLDRWSLSDGKFEGSCLVDDFKNFLYWREHGTPDRTVFNFFAAAALHSREGWLIVARMASHHSSAGRIFMPCGSLHTDDVKAGRVDLDGNIFREIAEELGAPLCDGELQQPFLIFDGARIAYMRAIKLRQSAAEIVASVDRHLAAIDEPEFSSLLFVKGMADVIKPEMPAFTEAYIHHAFAHQSV
jgi:hypothetical protein